ncbi:DUF4269 domain-containing protein [Aliidiomarina shirensis]|uniref:DUF4269 domain-containing protein n=1 Tax=Aliidiomarina shirensis TaxID=1048642 RepID=A0A432WXU5_9GAMM|nr:DUF4269 domain-containing protein [Aliidiomarina shirensis]RUO38608.1 DUF4269 domain-containing protein [Aliidiomarina shirensis]
MNSKIARANRAIKESEVLTKLDAYSPEVVSTIFVSLDTNESDIDIVCTYQEQEAFIEAFASAYSGYESYRLYPRQDHALGQFHCHQFLIEVYASKTPVKFQPAFRHYQVMKRLVNIGGNEFIEKIRQLKESGLKTEPAICRVMEISGEPYAAVLELERWSENELKVRLAQCL